MRCILGWLVLTWLPLVLLCVSAGTAWGNKVRLPLLQDFSIYGRFLVALPLLIAAEFLIDPVVLRVLKAFESSGIIRQQHLPIYQQTVEKISRLRDSRIAQLILGLLAGFPYFLFVAHYEWLSHGVSTWHRTASEGLSLSGWWFAIVSSPIPRFFMFRWLWRYILWVYLLWRVSRFDLCLLPTHPDRLGGLGFLLNFQQHFGILAAALGSVLSGQFANEMGYFGQKFAAIRAPMIVFIVSSLVVILLPVTVFSFKLFDARRDGLVRYSLVARGVTGTFDAKWTGNTAQPPDLMVGSQDPSSLIDYINSYDVIKETQVVPITKSAIINIAAQAAAPFALVWILATPSERVLTEIIKRLV